MSKENNIQDFDNFFRDAFSNFEPNAPQGVWEGIQSQLGTAQGAGAAGTGAATKTGFWGLGKIIIGSVTAVAVATTIYIAATNSNTETGAAGNEVAIVTREAENNTGANAENKLQSAGDVTPENNEGAVITDAGKTKTIGTNHTSQAATNSQKDEASHIHNGSVLPATQPGTSPGRNDAQSNTSEKPAAKTTVMLYVSDNKLCVNEETTFTLADDISKYTYRVNFGDGTSVLTQKGKPLTHRYLSGGTYKITATDLTGTREAMEQTVEVSTIKARFTVENLEKAIFKFTNTSVGATQYSWFFGDGKEGTSQPSPVYAYTSLDAAEYKVKLIAISENGCVDSFSQRVKQTYTYDDIKPIIPNVFSPNSDGINDRFDIGVRNEESYHLEIMDRDGNKVFESFSKENTWDGKNMYTGEECPATTYMMVFVYKIKGFEEKKVAGTVSIKR